MAANLAVNSIHVGLLSDQPMRLEGLVSMFDEPSPPGKAPMVPVTGSLESLLAQHPLDYLVVDLVSESTGPQTLQLIHRTRPSIGIVAIGPEGNDELILAAIIAGARAFLYVTANLETVRSALEVVRAGTIYAPPRLLSKLVDRLLKAPDSSLTNGPPHLTDREKQVLELILTARSNREIARQLGIEVRTVKAHVGRLMRKTGADNRVELTMRALNRPLLPSGRTRNDKPANQDGL